MYLYLLDRQSSMQYTTGYCLGRHCILSPNVSACIFYFSVFIVEKQKDNDGKAQFENAVPATTLLWTA